MPGALCQAVARSVLLLMLALPVHAQTCDNWPLWQAFSASFIQADGRVLADEGAQRYSTSEGQAYALFFSLVANDRTSFEKVLSWTRDNMGAGDLSARLPAWQWGKREDGNWGVLDENSASDANTWLAYTLLEAGRLWREPGFTAQGNLLLAGIRIHLVHEYAGMGMMLTPGETGFDLELGGIRLNPSYFPLQLLRVFARTDPGGPWDAIIDNNFKMLKSVSGKGFVPDWVAYIPGKGFQPDPKQGSTGRHDAIRVYLWWGMLSGQDALSSRLEKPLSGMNKLIPGREVSPPLAVDTLTGMTSGVSPPSFSAALLPYFAKMHNGTALRLQQERLLAARNTTTGALIGQTPRYYDQVLTLFGQGWLEHRLAFNPQGQLLVKWESSCSTTN